MALPLQGAIGPARMGTSDSIPIPTLHLVGTGKGMVEAEQPRTSSSITSQGQSTADPVTIHPSTRSVQSPGSVSVG